MDDNGVVEWTWKGRSHFPPARLFVNCGIGTPYQVTWEGMANQGAGWAGHMATGIKLLTLFL